MPSETKAGPCPLSAAVLATQARYRRERWVRGLNFLPFEWAEYARLSWDRKSPLPCARCGVLYLENLTETFCSLCCEAMWPRAWWLPKPECGYAAARELSPQELDLEIARRETYKTLHPAPAPAPEPEPRPRPPAKAYRCKCGKKIGAAASRCLPCSKLVKRTYKNRGCLPAVAVAVADIARDEYEDEKAVIRDFLRAQRVES